MFSKDLKQRFRSEYISLLIEKNNTRQVQTFKVGDIVLIGLDVVKRVNWYLGLVLEIFPRVDGSGRVALNKKLLMVSELGLYRDYIIF